MTFEDSYIYDNVTFHFVTTVVGQRRMQDNRFNIDVPLIFM